MTSPDTDKLPMSRETDNQERQTVRALLPTVSPDTDKLLREILRCLNITYWVLLLGGSVVVAQLLVVDTLLRGLIEAQAP